MKINKDSGRRKMLLILVTLAKFHYLWISLFKVTITCFGSIPLWMAKPAVLIFQIRSTRSRFSSRRLAHRSIWFLLAGMVSACIIRLHYWPTGIRKVRIMSSI
ncbi:membrane protein [methanotrophic bacterial endosymbiont of Bathymodiolus sp.]|nr:membrane protein [methanotrophic bacterial endosymbiont of Bathymodiolus sp.]